MKKNTVFKDTNLKQQEFIKAVLAAKHSVYIFGGAIRGGKTFVAIAIAILLCKIFPKSRWTIVRKDLKRLKDNTRPSLDKFIEGSGWRVIEGPTPTFISPEGSRIIFKGENYDRDKSLDSFKGHETNGFIFEEINEVKEVTFNKGVERAGSYIIVPEPAAGQPPPLIIGTCNPTQGWVKTKIYDPWKNNKLPPHMYYLPSYVTDNPELPKAYVDNLKNLPLYEYEVFVKGNWDITLKTQNAFWHAIDVNTHIRPTFYDAETTIHVSIDANVMPYCTATFWQVYPDEKIVRQFDEITAKDPYNHAGGLGRQVVALLDKLEYSSNVYVYGDATTKNQNSIDEKKRSFFDIFIEEIQEKYHSIDNLAASNPQIASTAEFVNALYSGFEGWTVEIGENCKESISDYLTVKTDMDGTMQKKKITDENGNSFEEYGHISDTKRYFLFRCLDSVFINWKNRFSTPSEPIAIEIGIGDSF